MSSFVRRYSFLPFVLVFSILPPSVQTAQPVTLLSRENASAADTLFTFTQHLAPLLKENCTPCHFAGGKVFEKYPFDSYATVFRLRKKLGTRLKSPEQTAILSRWIETGAKEK